MRVTCCVKPTNEPSESQSLRQGGALQVTWNGGDWRVDLTNGQVEGPAGRVWAFDNVIHGGSPRFRNEVCCFSFFFFLLFFLFFCRLFCFFDSSFSFFLLRLSFSSCKISMTLQSKGLVWCQGCRHFFLRRAEWLHSGVRTHRVREDIHGETCTCLKIRVFDKVSSQPCRADGERRAQRGGHATRLLGPAEAEG